MKKSLFVLTITIFGLVGCTTKSNHKNQPNIKIASEFEIDSTQLIYQYYQKFGFNEVCEDIRMVTKMKNSPNLKNTLPISKSDLEIINNFSNKADSVISQKITFKSNTRNEFYDIELDYTEFISDSLPTIKLTNGEYEIITSNLTSTLKIFDKESELLYIESHRCD